MGAPAAYANPCTRGNSNRSGTNAAPTMSQLIVTNAQSAAIDRSHFAPVRLCNGPGTSNCKVFSGEVSAPSSVASLSKTNGFTDCEDFLLERRNAGASPGIKGAHSTSSVFCCLRLRSTVDTSAPFHFVSSNHTYAQSRR